MAARSYFGLNLEVGKEMGPSIANGLKVLYVVVVGTRIGFLLVAIAVALSVCVGGRPF